MKFESAVGFEGFLRLGIVSWRVVMFGREVGYVKFNSMEFGDKY